MTGDAVLSKNIVLTGMMGSGKSSVAASLAKLLPDFELVELDAVIENREKISINDIFELRGETYFRTVETDIIKELSSRGKLIISLGGGAFLKEENRQLLKANSFSVYLSATVETLYNRLKNDESRPLLKSTDLYSRIECLLNLRREIYELADFEVKTDGKAIDIVASEILRNYK